jgi:GTP-binding protein
MEKILIVKGGKGGDGCVAFRREKFRPRGGPDGGNGGRGGCVIFEADENLSSLEHINFSQIQAQNGENGKSGGCHGANGKDLVIKLPLGVIIRDVEKNVLIKDLQKHRESVVVAIGGKGGRGNRSFATPTNQAPTYAEKGQDGQIRKLRLELKIIADIGIIGLPNSGKSTLLSKISKARPKIGAYLFTTLHPNLGVIEDEKYRTLTLADLPGIIEDATKGRGLGTKFLKHIERTRFLLHLVDVSSSAIMPPDKAYRVVRNEIKQYSKALYNKPELVVANKSDLPGFKKGIALLKKAVKKRVTCISALTGRGIPNLKKTLFKIALKHLVSRLSSNSQENRNPGS